MRSQTITKSVLPLLSAFVFLVMVAPAKAQFQESRIFLSPSVGLGPEGGGSAYGALAEFRVADKVGVGAVFVTWGWTKKEPLGFGDWFKTKATFNEYGVYGIWHFLPSRKFDPFVGVGIFNEDVSISVTCSFDPASCQSLGEKFESGVTGAPMGGVRYFFSPNFAVQVMATAGLYYSGAVGLTLSF